MVAQTIKLPVLIRRTDRCQNKNYFTGETFCVESIKTERRLGYGKMECPQCHSSCGKTDKFCSECGFKLAVPVKDPVNQGDSSQSIQPEQPLVGDSEGNHKEGNELFEDAQESLTMSEDDVTSKVEGSLEENMGASKEPEPPEDLTIVRTAARSVSLSWRRPAGLEDTLTYVVSYHSSRDENTFTCTSSSAQISNLKPATEYNFSVKGCDENGVERMAVSKNAWQLRKHLLVHKGEKPHACARCGKSFSERSNLRRHQKTHDMGEGLQRFECVACGKSYREKGSLVRHQKSAVCPFLGLSG